MGCVLNRLPGELVTAVQGLPAFLAPARYFSSCEMQWIYVSSVVSLPHLCPSLLVMCKKPGPVLFANVWLVFIGDELAH